jgi:hypothetical protein
MFTADACSAAPLFTDSGHCQLNSVRGKACKVQAWLRAPSRSPLANRSIGKIRFG